LTALVRGRIGGAASGKKNPPEGGLLMLRRAGRMRWSFMHTWADAGPGVCVASWHSFYVCIRALGGFWHEHEI